MRRTNTAEIPNYTLIFKFMANLGSQVKKLAVQTNFRYIQNIESLSDKLLEKKGYYRGYPCGHGHVIRDVDSHWCYFCVQKIKNNVCGFDVNYLHPNYKHKYASLWKKIQITNFEDCWETRSASKRICIASYRSFYANQKSENVTFHKAIYQCAWGDVGSMVVTRICKNKNCCNPLHLISTWNRIILPEKIIPFEVDFKAEKLMQYAKLSAQDKTENYVRAEYKHTIAHPMEANDPPEEHEA